MTRIGDRGSVVVVHCGQPMIWTGSSTNWVGKPGDRYGAQLDRYAFECLDCGAQVTISQWEPDKAGDAVAPR